MNRKLDNPFIEKSIKFLAKKIDAYSVNPKPVVYHSIRVGFLLLNQGYSDEIVIAGILHDVCEDAGISHEEINTEFNKEIGNIVQANTFNSSIQDKKTQYIDCFERCKIIGLPALIVKAADIYENSFYYHLAKNKSTYDKLIQKMYDFIQISKDEIINEPLFSLIEKQYQELKNIL